MYIRGMERRSFIKLLGLATTCVIVDPLIPDVIVPERLLTVKTMFIKISNTIMNDAPSVRHYIESFAMDFNDPEWERKTEIEIGFDGDDFTRNLQTIKLHYNSAAL